MTFCLSKAETKPWCTLMPCAAQCYKNGKKKQGRNLIPFRFQAGTLIPVLFQFCTNVNVNLYWKNDKDVGPLLTRD